MYELHVNEYMVYPLETKWMNDRCQRDRQTDRQQKCRQTETEMGRDRRHKQRERDRGERDRGIRTEHTCLLKFTFLEEQ